MFDLLKIVYLSCVWWHIPLILGPGQESWMGFCVFKFIPVYIIPEVHSETLYQTNA